MATIYKTYLGTLLVYKIKITTFSWTRNYSKAKGRSTKR
jgi:hypothetical protein